MGETYRCKNCNFHFKRSESGNCPYCGKKDIEKEKGASELVEEVEDMLN
jgi:rubrerythrin